jgi:5' nucleotidase family
MNDYVALISLLVFSLQGSLVSSFITNCLSRNSKFSAQSLKRTCLNVQVAPGPDLANQIFCNVELNAANLEAVGFDMDFTLAQYNEAFDLLAYDGAKERLCKLLGYPKDVLDFQYRYETMLYDNTGTISP